VRIKPAAAIEKNARVFIEPMGGFEACLSAAILKKDVQLVVTDDKQNAEYIITGTAYTEKAGWAKTIFISGAPQSDASITMKTPRQVIWFLRIRLISSIPVMPTRAPLKPVPNI
jgi:hypothetical protein